MKKRLSFIIVICLVGFLAPTVLPAYSFFLQDTTVHDSIKTPQPDFSNVTVIVETAWGTSDKSVNVDVYLIRSGKKVTEIMLKKGQHQECSIELVNGLVVKIKNSKTGRLIKQYGKME